MALLGRTNRLTILRFVSFGAYLDDKAGDAILLPKRYLGEQEIGDEMDVFVYLDSEDRPVATTEVPLAEVGDCAYLECVATTDIGAFLNWGLPRDLFVPFSEQYPKMEKGKRYPVYIYIDNSDRIAASMRIREFIDNTTDEYSEGDEVGLFVIRRTDLGWEVAVDDIALGMVFEHDALTTLHTGMRIDGVIKEVRSDGKLGVALAPTVPKVELAEAIVENLRQNGGTSDLTDKSSPDDIFATYGVSKRAYKAAIGALYRERTILLTKELITLVEEEED